MVHVMKNSDLGRAKQEVMTILSGGVVMRASNGWHCRTSTRLTDIQYYARNDVPNPVLLKNLVMYKLLLLQLGDVLVHCSPLLHTSFLSFFSDPGSGRKSNEGKQWTEVGSPCQSAT